MRSFSLSFIALISLSLFLAMPLGVRAEEKSDLHILINYRAMGKKCLKSTNDQVADYSWAGWKLQSGVTDFRLNFSNLPKNLSRGVMTSAVEGAFCQIQGANNGILFHLAGESGENNPSNDHQNTIMWRTLPSNVVAMTYIWTDNGRLTDADTVFNLKYKWTLTGYNGQNDCGGPVTSFDLKDVATHEFSHWVGLNDLYDSRYKDLTMYGYVCRGELKKDTLGTGDILGIRALWP